MTTQTEALKQARQLLWRYRHETPTGNQPHMICHEVDDAFERIDEALAQPEQEPVAWLSNDGNVMFGVGPKSKYIHPLYTTPPKRKPLTDEDILTVARDHYNPHQRPEISFARAIEAAHNIKE